MTANSIASIGTSSHLDFKFIALRVLPLALDVKLLVVSGPFKSNRSNELCVVNSTGSKDIFAVLQGPRNSAHCFRFADIDTSSRPNLRLRSASIVFADSDAVAWLDAARGTWRIYAGRQPPL